MKAPKRTCRFCHSRPAKSWQEPTRPGIVYLLCTTCKKDHEKYGATLVEVK